MRALPHPRCVAIPEAAKARLRVLFLAKHAASGGVPHQTDGNHAVYHHELRSTLEAIGFDLSIGNSYEDLDRARDAHFVIPLLNRGGFVNSEMMAPLQLTRVGIPFLGASPILRGLSDDKHLSKLAARHHGVPTADWTVWRRGTRKPVEPRQHGERLVVKPNASSASWGIGVVKSWQDAIEHAEGLQAGGHDVLIEDYLPSLDIAVPVIGGEGPDP
jgi:D-alanine-D-alanine ligase